MQESVYQGHSEYSTLKNNLMALWTITVKLTGTTNSIHYEKGMSVDVITPSSSSPLSYVPAGHQLIIDAFKQKYGVDVKTAHILSSGYLDVKVKK